jgi:hypothetical protein
MNEMLTKMKQFVLRLNEYGIPLPLLRINGAATLTGTMVFLSFVACLLGQAGKISGFLGGVDLTQANYLFGISLAAYLGRRVQSNAATKTIDMGKEEG